MEAILPKGNFKSFSDLFSDFKLLSPFLRYTPISTYRFWPFLLQFGSFPVYFRSTSDPFPVHSFLARRPKGVVNFHNSTFFLISPFSPLILAILTIFWPKMAIFHCFCSNHADCTPFCRRTIKDIKKPKELCTSDYIAHLLAKTACLYRFPFSRRRVLHRQTDRQTDKQTDRHPYSINM